LNSVNKINKILLNKLQFRNRQQDSIPSFVLLISLP